MKETEVKTIAVYLVLILSAFLITIFLFSSLSQDILKALIRMGITPSANPQTFSWAITPENLKPETVVAYKSYAQSVDGKWSETELKVFSVESVTPATTIQTTTRGPVTTIPPCNLEGDACRSDEDCCFGYCCSKVCSSSKCTEELGFWWYLLAIPVFVVIGLIIVWMRSSRRTEEDEFERLKEKWSRGGQQ